MLVARASSDAFGKNFVCNSQIQMKYQSCLCQGQCNNGSENYWDKELLGQRITGTKNYWARELLGQRTNVIENYRHERLDALR